MLRPRVLVPSLRYRVGWIVLAMLLAFLPLNIHAAIQRVPLGGHAWGPVYLWIRVPLQVLLMLWTYRFATRSRVRTVED